MLKKTTIVTGFLGAGKTTLLNHLIKTNPEIRYAIIENEYGEESIDGDLIMQSSDDIVELNNGCLCCTLNDNLYDLLSDLHFRRDDFDELIIEATGIADPSSIAEPFLIHPAVKNTFELVKTICVIDAEHIEDRLKDTEEARRQIAFSDILLIGKTHLVSPTYLKDLKGILEGINPNAKVVLKENDIYPDLEFHRKDLDKNELLEKQNCTHTHSHDEKCDHQHEHENKSRISHRHSDIITHSFVFSEAFDIELLYQQLYLLFTIKSRFIYRFKAIVYAKNNPNKILMQSVGKRLGVEAISPWKEDEEKKSKFVFIGKNLNPDGFNKLLMSCIEEAA